MTVIDLTKHAPGGEPDGPNRSEAGTDRGRTTRTALDRLTAGEKPKAAVDTGEPLLPEWLRTWEALATTARNWAARNGYRVLKFLVQLPVLLCKLIGYSPVGVARIIAKLAAWIYDRDSAEMRAGHAANRDSGEYKALHGIRRANLHARLLVFTCIALVTAGPALAWAFPHVTGWIVGAFAGAWLIKLIPGRSLTEVAIGAGLCIAIGLWLPTELVKLPRIPEWVILVAVALVVVALGIVGRPKNKRLVKAADVHAAGIPVKPTAEMVVEALCRIGLPGMTPERIEKVNDEVRIVAPGVATSAHGYTLEFELPPGRTAEEVVGRRDKLAGALRRDLGCVWPSGNEDHHPGWTRLFLSHKPMNSAKQPQWPLAACKPVDIFDALPLFTDEQMKWVALTIAGTHTAVGGASGFGKSVWLRQLALAIAMDLRVRLVIIDGKRSGDFEHIRKLCHAFHEGAEPDEIAAQLDELRGLVAECLKRSKFLKGLPPEERSPKVTSALASKYKELRPIVFVYDEVQEGTEYGVKGQKEDMKIRQEYAGLLTRLARIARSAGVFMVLASQKPDSGVIPSSIMGNCSIRVAFKVSEQVHNDQILGTSARKNGIDATMFGARDRGLAWVKGGDTAAAQVVRSWSEMVDMGLAVEMGDKVYEMRRAGGWLTGQAAGELPEETFEPDLIADIRDVMDHPPVPSAHLAEIVDKLALLRPQTWGSLDTTSLGAQLRQRGIVPGTVWVRGEGDGKGIKRTQLDDPGEPDSAA